MPIGHRARQHVQQAQREQDPKDKLRDWIVDTGTSASWSGTTQTKPSYARPCLQHGSEPFWIGSSGAHFTASEMARIQAFVVTDFWWPDIRRTTRELIGNFMSICVIQRVLTHIVRALGHPAAPANPVDPWESEAPQQRLANDAATNAMPRMQHKPTGQTRPLARVGFVQAQPNRQTRELIKYTHLK